MILFYWRWYSSLNGWVTDNHQYIENVDYCKIVPITEQQSHLFSKNVILFGFEGMKLEEIKKKM